MNKEKIIESAKEYIKDVFKNESTGHDKEHTMRVYHNALTIAKDYPGCDFFIVSMAALLHDVDDYKLFDNPNNENARKFLNEQNVPEEIVEQVCEVINEISFSKNKDKKPTSLEAMIVQDADRLDARRPRPKPNRVPLPSWDSGSACIIRRGPCGSTTWKSYRWRKNKIFGNGQSVGFQF